MRPEPHTSRICSPHPLHGLERAGTGETKGLCSHSSERKDLHRGGGTTEQSESNTDTRKAGVRAGTMWFCLPTQLRAGTDDLTQWDQRGGWTWALWMAVGDLLLHPALAHGRLVKKEPPGGSLPTAGAIRNPRTR